EEHVIGAAMRVRVITDLRDRGVAGERGMVQRLDVHQSNRELEALQVDPPIHDRIEHEAVVRTRRERERQRHAWLTISSTPRPRLSIASAILQLSRFRRSTMFDTARTCANGTLWISAAYMNAAPSMLSTSGWNSRTTLSIDS